MFFFFPRGGSEDNIQTSRGYDTFRVESLGDPAAALILISDENPAGVAELYVEGDCRIAVSLAGKRLCEVTLSARVSGQPDLTQMNCVCCCAGV